VCRAGPTLIAHARRLGRVTVGANEQLVSIGASPQRVRQLGLVQALLDATELVLDGLGDAFLGEGTDVRVHWVLVVLDLAAVDGSLWAVHERTVVTKDCTSRGRCSTSNATAIRGGHRLPRQPGPQDEQLKHDRSLYSHMGPKLGLNRDELESFCQRWQIRELDVFGSALGDNFDEESDLDLLVSFEAEAEWSLLDHNRMETELEALIGREMDLVTRRSVERSQNWIRRSAILESAEPLYAAG